MNDPHFQPLRAAVAFDDTGTGNSIYTHSLDFIKDGHDSTVAKLRSMLGIQTIVAHNAPFEWAVLNRIGIHLPASRLRDSAVTARAAGAGSSLEAAAPQLLGVDKLSSGKNLIKLFSIPGPWQEKFNSLAFEPQVVYDNPADWKEFGKYCELDAKLGLELRLKYKHYLTSKEDLFQSLTMEMAFAGWPVDVDTVQEMQRRYIENMDKALADFRRVNNAAELNLASLKQMKEWCADRKIRANSFDEKHVASLLRRLEKKVVTMPVDDIKRAGYLEVMAMLKTKQILGGASLKKLVTILDTVGEDRRLRDQYLHCGAGQSLRTTGRSVQMQNLKRIAEPADMSTLRDDDVEWTNGEMAENLRQVFTASDPNGFLLVGDFKSVESRGLAWLAGEEWKLDAYDQGQDLYKVLASKIYGVPYDSVDKTQRQTGKVGELSCGYAAGSGAVQEFAKKMDVEMSEAEAAKLVNDWRAANPETVIFWADLDQLLDQALGQALGGAISIPQLNLKDGFNLSMKRVSTPQTLRDQHPGAQSLMLEVLDHRREPFLKRYFHGCYRTGRNVRFYKPSDRKTGDLWRQSYTDPKTGLIRHYELYGGKLAGILTQSFCRELFFQSLAIASAEYQKYDNTTLVGQFHDEIVVDWQPGICDLEGARSILAASMADSGVVPSFPLEADIKHAYRYIK